MKITNWCKKLSAAIAAAGIWLPSMAYAQVNIPLGDPSFEAYVVPAIGYAYADDYRPTSAWVDDPDSPPGYTQDNDSAQCSGRRLSHCVTPPNEVLAYTPAGTTPDFPADRIEWSRDTPRTCARWPSRDGVAPPQKT